VAGCLRPLPGQPQINAAAAGTGSEAAALASQGNQLQSFLTTGNLPPGVQGSLNQAKEAAKATVKAGYAQRGESGSSAEAQDLANVDETVAGKGADIAMQLFNTGLSEVGHGLTAENISTQLYQEILNLALSQDQQLGQAIGNFAGSLAPRPTINIGGTA
jgi:hypothetical protein